ncbi:MAG TPA: polysaccharide biosynthesis C-terminal domain-containing protein, partial [Vicinamibacterales bacterium]|nr:polysaccharide biosynthesis C-terminal domain-containing protein [Vicinamibacterales bacterium]
ASVLAIAFAALPFLILEQYGNGLLLATNRLRVYNRAIMIGKTLVFVCVGIAYLLGFDIRAAIAATVIGQVALVVTSAAPLVRASAGRMTFDGQILKKLLIGALKLHPSTVSNFVYAYVGVLVMNRYLGPSQTGIYQFAVQLFEVMLVVPYAANIVLFAKTGETGVHNAWPYQRRVLLMLVGVMAGAGIVAAVAAPFAIPLVGGRAFLPSVSPFRHLLIALCFLTVSAVMTSQWIGRGLFLPLSILNIAYVAISLAANLILTPRFGMSGAVASLILSYVIAGVVNLFFAVRCEREYREHGLQSTLEASAV